MDPVVYLPVPTIPCNDPGNHDLWMKFFDQTTTLLSDPNFYRVLIYCSASHSSCVGIVSGHSPSSSLSPSISTSPVILKGNTLIPAEIVAPCSTLLSQGLVNPIMSDACQNCVFADKCLVYKPVIKQISTILSSFRCPPDGVIDDTYVRQVMIDVLTNSCGVFDQTQISNIQVDQQMLDKVTNLLNTWRGKFPFPCPTQTSAQTFWQEYGTLIIIVIVLLSIAIAVMLFITRRERMSNVTHWSRERSGPRGQSRREIGPGRYAVEL